ncbi:MAG: hypothetical protein ACRDS9_04000 [Pseudonocardiaceae bacterium]
MKQAACAGVLLVLIAGAAGCEDQPDAYDRASGCGASTEVLRSVLGTDRFDVADEGSDLPIRPSASAVEIPRYVCEVYQGNEDPPLIDVEVELLAASPLGSLDEEARSADMTFQTAGGTAGLTTTDESDSGTEGVRFKAWWTCAIRPKSGTPVLHATGQVKSGKEDELKEMVKQVATAAGCGEPQPSTGAP